MPARKIPLNYLYLTGIVGATGSKFEATLERDFYILLSADKRVAKVDAQPITLTYRDSKGVLRPYTPDALVRYHPDPETGVAPKPRLCEVKPREKIRAGWPEIKLKYKAGRRFARLQDWSFGFVTEKEIRTPFLDNVKFLRRHWKRPAHAAARELLLGILRRLGETTPSALLEAATTDPHRKAQLIGELWKLVAAGEIGCDLEKPLTMRSPIRAPDGAED